MKHTNNYLIYVSILLVSSVVLASCADLAPVRTFSDETIKVTKAVDPMLSGSSAICAENFTLKKMILSKENYDPDVAENESKKLCGSIDEYNKVIENLNSILEQYAATINSLADKKLATYKPELDGLKDSLSKIKKSDSEDALLNSDKLDAIISLSEILSRAATEHFQKKAIADLLDHEKAINVISDALTKYATLNYKGWLKDKERVIMILRKYLKKSSEKEPLAANYLNLKLQKEEKKIISNYKMIDIFAKSVKKLKESNAELHKNFGRLDNKELLDKIVSFSAEVSKLNSQLKKAF